MIPTLNTTAKLEQRRLDPVTGVPMAGNERYLIPHPNDPHCTMTKGKRPSWQRATNAAAMLQDRFALERRGNYDLVLGLGARPDLRALAVAAALKPDDRKLLAQIVDQGQAAGGGDVKANQGTAFHVLSEVADTGDEALLAKTLEMLGHDGDLNNYRTMLRSYRNLLARHDIRVPTEFDGRLATLTETVVVCPQVEAAGTVDKYRWVDGVLAACDVKTGQHPEEYSQLEYAVQLAIAANATHVWSEALGQHIPVPAQVSKDVAYVLWVPAGQDFAELIKVNVRRGWEYLQLAVAVREARKDRSLFAMQGRVGADETWQNEQIGTPLIPAHDRPAAEPDPASLGAPYSAEQIAKLHTADDGPTVPAQAPVEPVGTEPVLDWAKMTPLQRGAARLGGTGKPLEPLASELGEGRKGCSRCGRVGHRRTSAVCLGDDDPRFSDPNGSLSAESDTSKPSVPSPDERTPDSHASAGAASTSAQVPVPAGVIACGPDGQVTELAPPDARAVEAFATELEQQPREVAAGPAQLQAEENLAAVANTAPPWCVCTTGFRGDEAAGWSNRGDGVFVHGLCKLPSYAATQAAYATHVAATQRLAPEELTRAAQAAQYFTANPSAQPPEGVAWPPPFSPSVPTPTPSAMPAGATPTPAPASPPATGAAAPASSTAPPVTAPAAGPTPFSTPAASSAAAGAGPVPVLTRIAETPSSEALQAVIQELTSADPPVWSQEIALAAGRRQYELANA